jgi:hypothetical protein
LAEARVWKRFKKKGKREGSSRKLKEQQKKWGAVVVDDSGLKGF